MNYSLFSGINRAKLLLGVTLICLNQVSSFATPITYTFSGQVTGGNDVGQTVNGTFRFDPSLFSISTASFPGGSESNVDFLSNPGTSALAGSARTTDNVVFIGSGNQSDKVLITVDRNFSGTNQFFFEGISQNCNRNDCWQSTIQINIFDFNGASSTLFSDPTSGSSLNQSLNVNREFANFNIEYAQAGGFMTNATPVGGGGNSAGFQDVGLLTVVKQAAFVPEPSSLYLMMIASLCMAWQLRKRYR